MNIVHFAPFAPNGCGLYEAARDMIVADKVFGHESNLVDTGATVNGEAAVQGEVGKIDARGMTEVITASPDVAMYADVLIAHTGVPDPWISKCQAPLIWMLHGRPQACFQPEQFGRGHSFSLINMLASWPRVKAMVTFWPYHEKFWLPIIPREKLICFQAPPVDCSRFAVTGKTHDYSIMGDEINVVLADSWREDVDLYEITNGVIEFARREQGVKFHFYGVDGPPACWEYLFNDLRMYGALGEIWARRPGMDEVYRAADVILSPHRITTRVIAEALCCGTPVVAAQGCSHATWTCDPGNPDSVATALSRAIKQIKKSPQAVKKRVKKVSKEFSLAVYAGCMNELISKVL